MVLRATEVVAFAADQREVTSGQGLGAIGLENIEEAATRRREQAGFFPGQAGGLEEGGREVGEADVVGDLATRAGDAGGPADSEGQVVGVLVGRALHPGERHAVVGSHDDQRAVQFAAGFQLREDFAQLGVEVFDLHCVIKHVAADRRVVGPVFRHAVHVGQLLAEARMAAFFVGAVGFLEAEPEEPRLAGLGLREEGFEVSAVVILRDSGRRRLGFFLHELLARHGAR